MVQQLTQMIQSRVESINTKGQSKLTNRADGGEW